MIKVIKIGGNVVDNPELLREFVRDFAAMPGMKVLVHGGGSKCAENAEQQSQTAQGNHPNGYRFAPIDHTDQRNDDHRR